MRRALAITLLIAFFSPFLAPLSALTATDPEANLPPCCRSHGMHHCAMMHMHLAPDPAAPAFTPTPCPLYPTAATVPQLATFTLAAAPQLFAQLLPTPVPPAATPRRAHLFVQSAHLTRGPPALPA